MLWQRDMCVGAGLGAGVVWRAGVVNMGESERQRAERGWAGLVNGMDRNGRDGGGEAETRMEWEH